MFLKIKPGHQIGQNGKTYSGNDVIDVPGGIAGEFLQIADPCDKDGVLIEAPAAVNFAGYRLHEQITLWEQELEKRKAAVEEAKTNLAAAKKAHAEAPVETAPPVDEAAPEADTQQ